MHTHKYLKYTATPIKTLCILLVVMFLAGIAQLIVTQVYWEFTRDQWDLSRQEKQVVEQTEQEKQQRDIHSAGKNFTPDGTLYLTTTSLIPGTRESKYIVKDADNNVVFEGKQEESPYSFIQWQPKRDDRNYHYHRGMNQSNIDELNLIGGEFSRHLVVPMVNPDNKRIGHWFFDTDKRVFKYYTIAGRQGGYLGANGYTENISDAVGFDKCKSLENWLRTNSYDPMAIYQSEGAIYQIDFQKKQVETLVKTANDPILRMRLTNWRENENYDYRPHLIAVTKSKKVYLFVKHPDQRIEILLSDDYLEHAMPLFAANEKNVFARHEEMPDMPKTNNRQEMIDWYMENRNKEKRHRVRLFEVTAEGAMHEKTSFIWTEPAQEPNITMRSTRETIFSVINSVSSPVPIWTTLHWFRMDNYRQWPVWSRETMGFIRAYSAFKTPVNLCVMTVFAALALLHGWPRRTHIAKLIGWTVFVFLFNLPGFLTYLALNHTPVIHCANCNKQRGLNQDACCRCRTALPLPKTKETDLVMPLPA